MKFFMFFHVVLLVSSCSSLTQNIVTPHKFVKQYKIGDWEITIFDNGSVEFIDSMDGSSFFRQKITGFGGSVTKHYVFENKPKIIKRKNKVFVFWDDYIREEWHQKDNDLIWDVIILQNPNHNLKEKNKLKEINLNTDHNLNILNVSGHYNYSNGNFTVDVPEARFGIATRIKNHFLDENFYVLYSNNALSYNFKNTNYPITITSYFQF